MARSRAAAAMIWLIAGAASMWACSAVVSGSTPIDQALPLLAAVATILAWSTEEAAIAIAIPLLMIFEVSVADEQTRLLLIGFVMAACFAAALARGANHYVLSVLALVVLRWIPFHSVVIWRELVILGAVALLIATQPKRTPLSFVAAMALAFVTPAAPTRALLTPLGVAALQPIRVPAALILAAIALFSRPSIAELCLVSAFVLIAPLLRSRVAQAPFLLAAAVAMALFAWSGAVARGPAFLLSLPDRAPRQNIGVALAPSESIVLDLPRGTRRLVISAATATHLRKGRLLGTVEPVLDGHRRGATRPPAIAIRVGDVADWGYMRREQWFRSRNPFPRRSAGSLHDYGQDAWVDGAGLIELPPGVTRVRVTANARLSAGARLQIEGSE